MKEGKFTVTAAEASGGKNVDCGFIPAYVKLLNRSAPVDTVMQLERYRGMAALESLQTVSMRNDGGDNLTSPIITTTVGLSNFDDGSVSQVETALTGSAFTRTIDTTTLTGTGSAFTTEVNVGDRVRVGEEFLEVASITSDTVLLTTSVWRDATAASAATVVVPGAEVSQSGFKGFSIPAGFLTETHIHYFIAMGTQFDEEDA